MTGIRPDRRSGGRRGAGRYAATSQVRRAWPGSSCSGRPGLRRSALVAAPRLCSGPAMPLKLQFKGGLFRCGRCRKSFSSPLGHVCTVRNPKGRMRLKPKASALLATCKTCGKSYSNPLGHVCTVKTDFKRRKAAGTRRAAAEEKRKKAAAARAREVTARRARRTREDEGRRKRRATEKAPAGKAPAGRAGRFARLTSCWAE